MTTEADSPRDVTRLQNATAVGGVLGAIAASSCCMLPLLLFTLGASGSWICTLVRLAPYQPYFIPVPFGCVGGRFSLSGLPWKQQRTTSFSMRSAAKIVYPPLLLGARVV